MSAAQSPAVIQPSKYITRVANRLLNVMNGTGNTVK
jgi:hypothetical protein